MSLVRGLFGVFNGLPLRLQNALRIGVDRIGDGKGEAKPSNHPNLRRSAPIRKVAAKGEEEDPVNDAMLHDNIAAYRQYGMRISQPSSGLPDLNSRFVSHL